MSPQWPHRARLVARLVPTIVPTLVSTIVSTLVALLACGLIAGCRPTEIRLRLRSAPLTNGGRAVVVLVRSIEGAQPYRRDRYGDIERLVITPDASVLRVLSLPPGLSTPQTFRFPYPPQGGLALYAMYGTAVADWRVLFLAPIPDRIDLTLGTDGIDRSQTREHRPLRLPRLPTPPAGIPAVTPPALPSLPTASLPTASLPTASLPTASMPTASMPTANPPSGASR